MSKVLFLASVCGMLVIAIVTTASACGSGIQATVTLGPTCPVERPGMVCYKPYAAAIAIYGDSDRFIKTIHSSADGKFRVDLKPGTYTLRGQPVKSERPVPAYPMAKPVTVAVKACSYTGVNILFDTGIR